MLGRLISRALMVGRTATQTVYSSVNPCAKIIDGKAIAREIRHELKHKIREWGRLNPRFHHRPCLGYVMVGNDPSTQVYVKMKKKACEEIGIEHSGILMPEDSTQEEVIDRIKELNMDDRISGIMIQMPLPRSFSNQAVFDQICPEKDVDGVNPNNVVDLVLKEKQPQFIPCTAKGCLHLIHKYMPSVEGKRCVVVGQSMIVGAPIAYSLQNMDATVTMCNAKTRNLESITREGDVLVVSIGCPEYIKAEWIKPGAIVIDVGINVVPDKSSPSGKKIVGDVDFHEAKKVAGYITPVPGGVGPMTTAMLMENVYLAWKRQNFSLPPI